MERQGRRVRVRTLKAAGALMGASLVALVAGCSGRGPAALPTISSLPEEESQAVGSATYRFGDDGQIEIYHQGYGVRSVQGVPVGTMRIQVSVKNQGPAPLKLNAGETHLVDNRGDTLVLGALQRDGQPTTSVVEVDPGSHAQVDLFFDLPESYAMEKVDNFRIYWGYQLASARVATETLFLRKDPGNMYWVDGRGKKRRYRYFMAVKA